MPYPSLQDVVHEWQGEEGQTEATMLATQLEVIADELRTANLIAYLNVAATIDLAWHPSESVLKSVQARVEERLGLA